MVGLACLDLHLQLHPMKRAVSKCKYLFFFFFFWLRDIYSMGISNRMGTIKNGDTYFGNTSFSQNIPIGVLAHRNLGKNNLGGVIFGCKDNTMKECLFKQIFGELLVVHV